jgi:hypothetical protein
MSKPDIHDQEHDHLEHDDTRTDGTDGTETAVEAPVGSPETPDPTGSDQPADELAAVTAERDALAVQVQRLTVAAEKGVPVDLLTGTSKDELHAQADALLSFAAERSPAADFGAGQRGGEPTTGDPIRRLLGR